MTKCHSVEMFEKVSFNQQFEFTENYVLQKRNTPHRGKYICFSELKS